MRLPWLPPTAYSLIYTKLINLLLGNLSPEQQSQIEVEIANQISSTLVEPSSDSQNPATSNSDQPIESND